MSERIPNARFWVGQELVGRNEYRSRVKVLEVRSRCSYCADPQCKNLWVVCIKPGVGTAWNMGKRVDLRGCYFEPENS